MRDVARILSLQHTRVLHDRKCRIEYPSTDSESSRRAGARGTRRNVVWWRYECVTARGRRLGVWASPAVSARTRIRWTFGGQFQRALETEHVAALDGLWNYAAVPDFHPLSGGDLGAFRMPPRRAFFARKTTVGLTLHGESDATFRLSVRAVCAKLCA